MELIDKYFPGLTELQRQQFAALYGLYADWNAKINVVSHKDFDQLYLRHVLHSLAIAKVCTWYSYTPPSPPNTQKYRPPCSA